jgi:esterase/lipase superfamily enzyme
MMRQHHKWFSHSLGRDMELLVFGRGGAKVLVFPTREGRFYDYENWGQVNTLRHAMGNKGIPHRLAIWPGEAHRARYWREMAPHYL